MILEELTTVLGLEIQSDGLDGFNSSVGSAIGRVAALGAATVVAAVSISSFLDAAADAASSSRFAQSIDVGFESLQRLEFAAQQATGSTSGLRSALQGLRASSRGAFFGFNEGAAAAFAQLGISIANANGQLKNSDQLLLEVADAVASVGDRNFQEEIARQLGIGPDLLLLFRLGSDGIRGLGDEAERLGAILGGDAAKRSIEFEQNMDKLQRTLKTLLFEQGQPLLEWITSVTERFSEFLKSDRGNKTIEVFSGIATSIGKIAGAPFEALAKLSEFMESIGLGENQSNLIAFGGAIAALGVAFFPTTSAVVLLLLALQDLVAFFNGEEGTVIGQISSGIGSRIDEISDLTKKLSPFLSALPGSGPIIAGGIVALRESGISVPGFTLNNPTFNFENNTEVNGTGDPDAVAARVVGGQGRAHRDTFIEGLRSLQSQFSK